MKNIYEIPDQALCSVCEEIKDGEEFSKSQFLVFRKEPPVCRECSIKDRKLWAERALQTKMDQEGLMLDHILTKLGYDLNRDIHEQFLERHKEELNK